MSYLIVHLNAGSNDGEVVLEVFHLNMIFPYFYILELLNWLQLNQELGEYFAFVDTTFNFCIIFRPVLTKKGQRLFVTNARVVLSCAGCPGHYI